MHPEEKTLAKQLADKNGGKYTEQQIEDQMRIMDVSNNGVNESGAPTTLIGQMPTDSGARWISGGTTQDGKPILTQITAQANPELQSYILANYNGASSGGVPSQFRYPQTGSGSINITGPFTKFDKSDSDFMRNTTANTASMVSNTAGWISSTAATGAVSPSPLAPVFGEIAFGATVVGIAADGVSQLVRPNVGQYAYQGTIALAGQIAADHGPTASLVVNGAAAALNNAPYSTQIQDWITRQSNSIFNVNSNGTRK